MTCWQPRELGEMGANKGGDGLTVAFKSEADFQFIGDELEVGGTLQGDKLFQELRDGLRPIRSVIAARSLGAEARALWKPEGTKSVEMGAADAQLFCSSGRINLALVKLLQDSMNERIGKAFS